MLIGEHDELPTSGMIAQTFRLREKRAPRNDNAGHVTRTASLNIDPTSSRTTKAKDIRQICCNVRLNQRQDW